MSRRRAEALAAMELRCPRCGAAHERLQPYCVDCGLRLPPQRGAVASLRRRWVRRLGWYPGDWVWAGVPALAAAIAGAGIAIELGRGAPAAPGPTTIVAVSPGKLAAPAPRPAAAARNGRTVWPAGRDGWTVALVSYPVTGGSAPALAAADRAARGGLAQVGVLESSGFSSLHPGYYIVFSGIYSTLDEAKAALPSARATGFSSAGTRQISR